MVTHTSIPIATGKRMYTRWGFKNLIEQGYADIIQPDLFHAGGILECRKIAAMAEAYDVALAPHCPLGPIAWRLAFSWIAVHPMRLSRNKVWASITIRVTIFSTTWTTQQSSDLIEALSMYPPVRD